MDNWATCDLLASKLKKVSVEKKYNYVLSWINSTEMYKVRFAIVVALSYFLGDDFKPEFFEIIENINTDEYYINMASAWYFSFALIKQYDKTLDFIKKETLSVWVHNKAIQKAIESFRISPDQKT